MDNDARKTNLINIIFWGMCYFTYSYYVFGKLLSVPFPTDYTAHMEGAQQILDGDLFGFLKADSYPLWQILVASSAALFRMPLSTAAVFVCSLLNAFSFILVYRFLIRSDFCGKITAPLTCALLLSGPMYISWFSPHLYEGQGTPNIWHNPTTICVRPFAVVTFLLITRILKKCNDAHKCSIKELSLLAVMFIVCNIAKPSFMQGLLPGLALYFILKMIREKGKNISLYIKAAVAIIPGVLLLAIQWFISFYGSPGAGADNGIDISPFEVLHVFSPNVFISFVLGMAFPLYIVVCNWKTVVKKPDLHLLGCALLTSWLQMALLIETGARKNDGNFGWAYLIFMFITYVYAMREFLLWNRDYEYEKRKQRITVSVGWGLFFLQVTIGIYYTFHVYG